MKHTIETTYGTVEVNTAMIDVDGTNLEEGVDIHINGKLVLAIAGQSVEHFEEMSDVDMEKFLEENCDHSVL